MKFKQKSSEDTRNFVKMKDNETLNGIFRGDIYEFKTHWSDNRSTLCPGQEICSFCKSKDPAQKAKFRFRVNLIVKEGDGYVAKVFEQGWNVYKTLRDLNVDYPLEEFVMKVTRNGGDIHTSYTIIPLPKGLVTPELEKKLASLTLNDLSHEKDSEPEPGEGAVKEAVPPISDDEIPF